MLILKFIESIDIFVTLNINSFARQSILFDFMIVMVSKENIIKFFPFVIAIWWLWFDPSPKLDGKKAATIAILSSAFSIMISRLIQNLSVARPRPMHDVNIEYILPHFVNSNVLKEWSSLPSDNATLAAAISMSIFIFYKRAGIFAFIWTFVIICLPRIYIGFHFLSDLLSGIAIGAGVAIIFHKAPSINRFHGWFQNASSLYPRVFLAYPVVTHTH